MLLIFYSGCKTLRLCFILSCFVVFSLKFFSYLYKLNLTEVLLLYTIILLLLLCNVYYINMHIAIVSKMDTRLLLL